MINKFLEVWDTYQVKALKIIKFFLSMKTAN